MNAILISIIVFIVLLIALAVLAKVICKLEKELSEEKIKTTQLKSDIEWQKTKAKVQKEIYENAQSKKKKLNNGSNSDRFNAAASILRDNTNCSKKGNSGN